MMSGFLAWLVWVLIHMQFLAEGSLAVQRLFSVGLDVPQCKARLS
jgi:hypothetical protein